MGSCYSRIYIDCPLHSSFWSWTWMEPQYFLPSLGARTDTIVMSGTSGGSFLTTAAFNSFFPEMVQGRGWICIALVIFASWQPGKALFGAILFSFFDAYQLRLQHVVEDVPYQLFLMAPYVLSILALILVSRRAKVPEALMAPYRRGER